MFFSCMQNSITQYDYTVKERGTEVWGVIGSGLVAQIISAIFLGLGS